MERRSLLPPGWEVPEVFRRRLGSTVGRQRTMFADGHLLLVVHQPPGPEEDERQPRFFWRRPDGTWTSSDLGSGPQALAKHLDQFAEIVHQCDEIEDRATTVDQYHQSLEALAPVARSARNLHQVLQEARELCPDDRDLINVRDRAYEIERTAELVYTQTKNSLDFAVAKRAEEQARASHRMAISAHRLNMLAAFFFPLATLSGILGVNLRHGWEDAAPPLPFLLMVAGGVFAGFILMLFVATTYRE